MPWDQLLEERPTLASEVDARDAAIARIGPLHDEAVPGCTIDEARQIPRGHEHVAAQRRERLPAFAVEVGEQIEPRHRALGQELGAKRCETVRMALEQTNPCPNGHLRWDGAQRGSTFQGSTAIPSISTSAPGSRSPATFTRLMAG